MTPLTWRRTEPGVAEEELAAVEQALGVRFPPDYREHVGRQQGGTPSRSQIRYVNRRGQERYSALSAMVRVSPGPGSIQRHMENLAIDDQLPHGFVPFAEVGNGDLFCFAFVDPTALPRVVLWLHDAPADAATVDLADSFLALLEILEPDDDELESTT